jgi:hypothetical protein
VTATEPNAEAFLSALSRDGRRLAYVVRRAGSQKFELRVSDIGSRQSTLLDDDLNGNVLLAWSADGSAVLHQRRRRTGTQPLVEQQQLVRHELGGREAVLLPWSTQMTFFLTGTSGRDLLGAHRSSSNAPSEIVRRTTVGGTLGTPRVLLADPRANLWEATYAPGQRWISFVRQPLADVQRLDLMIAPADGAPPSEWTRIAPEHPWPDKPRWSVDGRLLYFLSRGAGSYLNVWAVPFDPIGGTPTGAAFAITHYESPALFVSPHVVKTSMSVANHRLALTMTSATGSVWMLDDLPAEDGPTPSQ